MWNRAALLRSVGVSPAVFFPHSPLTPTVKTRARRPRSEEGLRALLGVAILALTASGARAGETRCWLDKGAVVVPAAFGDIAGDFVLDLMRQVSALHDTRANMNGLTGTSATATLSLAGVSFEGTTLPILDLDAQTAPFDTTINGILGADLLRGSVLTLDFRGGGCRLTLARRVQRRRPKGVRLPLTWLGGIPTTTAMVSDGVKNRPGLFALGTSQAATLISAGTLSRPAKAGDLIRLRAVVFGGELFEQTPAEVGPAPASGLAGGLGTAILAHGRVVIDTRRGHSGTLYLSHASEGARASRPRPVSPDAR